MKKTVEQISVFIENRPGRLAEISRILGDAGVNMRALTLADTTDFGILRIIVNNVERAVEALKAKDFPVDKTDVVAIDVVDKPGGLATILDILYQASINVEYMYAFLERHKDNAVIIFRFDNIEEAIRVLESNGVNVLPADMIYQL